MATDRALKWENPAPCLAAGWQGVEYALIEWAEALGFQEITVDASAIAVGEGSETAFDAAMAALDLGRVSPIFSARGPEDAAIKKMRCVCADAEIDTKPPTSVTEQTWDSP